MKCELGTLLHPRILQCCKDLLTNGHFKHASHEAMTQVELALKERSGAKHDFGVRLAKVLLGEGEGIKLHVPFGKEMQKQAEALFAGAFSYYRNYTAHDGSSIDESSCIRIMVIASELLDLVSASSVSFAKIGGIPGLIKQGVFQNAGQIHSLLKLLDGDVFPDEVVDGLFESLAAEGFSEAQVHAVLDTGLIEITTENYLPSKLDLQDEACCPDTISQFKLTKLGREVVDGSADKAA